MANPILMLRVPLPIRAPAGAVWAAQAAVWAGAKLAGLGRAMWRFAEGCGRARAARHLRTLAAGCQLSQPQRARALRQCAHTIELEDGL